MQNQILNKHPTGLCQTSEPFPFYSKMRNICVRKKEQKNLTVSEMLLRKLIWFIKLYQGSVPLLGCMCVTKAVNLTCISACVFHFHSGLLFSHCTVFLNTLATILIMLLAPLPPLPPVLQQYIQSLTKDPEVTLKECMWSDVAFSVLLVKACYTHLAFLAVSPITDDTVCVGAHGSTCWVSLYNIVLVLICKVPWYNACLVLCS